MYTQEQVQRAIMELHAEELFYDELWKRYKRDNYLAMATSYKISARIVERIFGEEE